MGSTGATDTRVAALTTSHRFGASIGELASGIRVGDADRVIDMLRTGDEHIEWINTDDWTERLRNVLLPHALRLQAGRRVG